MNSANIQLSSKEYKIDLLLAFFQRLAVLCGLFLLSSQAFNLSTFPGLRDGGGYLNLARGFLQGSFKNIPFEDTQYFVGYPLILSFFLRFLTPWAAVYLLQLSCIAGSLYFGSRLFENPWIARWLTLCIPSYVLFTSTNMSESLIVLLMFSVVYTYRQKHFLICSFLLGCALITRPQSMVFLYIILLMNLAKVKRFDILPLMIVLPGAFLLVMHLFNYVTFGDTLHNYRLYSAHESSQKLIAMPFAGYLTYSQDLTIRITNKIYIWGFTLFTSLGLFLSWVRFIRKNTISVEQFFLFSGTMQLLFLMCLNSRWGFMELPRYFIPVMPSALLGYFPFFPKKRIFVYVAGILCILFSIYAEGAGNRYAQ